MHYLGPNLVCNFMFDQIMDGTTCVGWSRTKVSESFAEESIRAMKAFVDFTQPTGAGGVDFLSSKGRPMLVDINSARFTGAHPAKLLFEEHAPDKNWSLHAWDVDPKKVQAKTMGELWSSMLKAGIAFQPGKDTPGLFPTHAMLGCRLQFLVLGPNPEVVQQLKAAGEEVMYGTHANLSKASPQSPGSDICPVCLQKPSSTSAVELSCGHIMCKVCMMAADAHKLRHCPMCRCEHVLDWRKLQESNSAYRAAYAGWRDGNAHGAHGEPCSIVSDPSSQEEGKSCSPQAAKAPPAQSTSASWDAEPMEIRKEFTGKRMQIGRFTLDVLNSH
ncbi:unnamed protein product [Polarella glacialis]|uniref:RING-type domain-containing protein n=1 Tax=Polarella glacialis TaxID=89957 RepID=A0A813GQT5_POLGL|nr:unnamed protein product [Polarella glacialis]